MYNIVKLQRAKALCKSFEIMKKKSFYVHTQLVNTPTEQGESIEEMLRRLTASKQPIPSNVPPIYTPMEEGVIGDYDIRKDRFNVAIEAQDKFAASNAAKAAEKPETDKQTDEE